MRPLLFANPEIGQAYQQDPRMGLAQGLMQNGSSTAPVQSWGEALARALQAPLGGVFAGQARKDYQAQDDKYRKGLSTALQGGDVLAALQNSDDPSLQQMGLDAKLRQALSPAEKDPLVKVYDPDTKTEKYIRQSQAAGLQAEGPQSPKVGDTRKYRVGDQDVTDQWDGQKWVSLGSGAAFAPDRATQSPYYGQVIQGVDKDGKAVILQIGKDGTLHQAQTPEGVTITPPVNYVNTGTSQTPVPRYAGQPTGAAPTVPIDVAGKSQQQTLGQNTGQAQFDLPTATNNANMALSEIDAIRKSPGISTGLPSVVLNQIPGTDWYGFQQRVDQAKAGAFLQAYNSLRGGGAISDAEGAKATASLARLNTAQNKKDFLAALDDFEGVIKRGLAVANQKAGGTATQETPPATPAIPPPPPGFTVVP